MRSGVMLNAVDDTPRCTFIAPSIVRRVPVTLAIFTGGVSLALARKLRETLADASALDWVDLPPVLARPGDWQPNPWLTSGSLISP